MVVDSANRHVFVSGYSADDVFVMSYSGTVIDTISVPGPSGMVIDGSTLYVAEPGAGVIGRISLSNLTIQSSIGSSLFGIQSLAVADNELWTSDNGGVYSVSLSGTVTGFGIDSTAPEVDSSTGDPNHIYLSGLNGSAKISSYNVSSGSPVAGPATPVNTGQQETVVSPDGTRVIAASNGPDDFPELAASNLQPDGVVYPGGAYPSAVAVSPGQGGLLATGLDTGTLPDVQVFKLGQTTPIVSLSLASPYGGADIPPHGLAMSDDGALLFVMQSSGTFGVYSLTSPILSVAPTGLNFDYQRVGTYYQSQSLTLTNSSNVPLNVAGIYTSGLGMFDYVGGTTCTQAVGIGQSCRIDIYFWPLSGGPRPATLLIYDNAPGSPQQVSLSGYGTQGYYVAGAAGELAYGGDAQFFGDAARYGLNAPIVSVTTTTNGDGYWLLGRDGGVFSYGNATFFGSTGNIRLNKPVVGMTRTPDSRGYWFVASDGGVFSYGDAGFYGSTGNVKLYRPIVGMTSTPDGGGYWMVASDGGIFAFGDAQFYGSTGGINLAKPIVGMAVTPDGRGYWIVASDGGVFAFGDAHFYGSTGSINLAQPIVGMAATADGGGYWMVASDGGIFAFGDAPFFGSLGGAGVTDVVGFAGTSPPDYFYRTNRVVAEAGLPARVPLGPVPPAILRRSHA